jgi:6,7-dimethyl-8-ribityllumazine synthase
MKSVPASKSPRVAFLVAEFHRSLVDAMLWIAANEAKEQGLRVVRTLRVPGCYETPLVAKRLLARRDVDGLVVLGFIERGETLHGEVMGHVVHRALLELGLAANKPVGLGLIGPGATKKQAEARKKASARAAVRAVVHSLEALAAAGD